MHNIWLLFILRLLKSLTNYSTLINKKMGKNIAKYIWNYSPLVF